MKRSTMGRLASRVAGVEPRSRRRAPPRKRRKIMPGVLTLLALFFVSSALARVSMLPGEATWGAWQALAAWAQQDAGDIAGSDTSPVASLPDPDALIEALLSREAELQEREKALETKEHSLRLAQSELRAGLAEFERAEAALRQTLSLADGAAQADLDRLTRMYETMKPKDAAALFETMDPVFAAGFLGQMSPAAAAEILSGMAPASAYTVSLVLAGRNVRVPVD